LKTKQVIKRQARTHYLTEFPSIFKPIKRGAREKAVEINYKYSNGSEIKIKMFKQLDISDQDLFLAIVSLMSEHSKGKLGKQNSTNLITQDLREKLELKDMLFDLPILRLQTTIYKLLNIIGKTINNINYKWCLQALERLGDCSIWYKTDRYTGHSNLLSYSIDNRTKEIHIAINPVSASVYLANDKYVIHNLQERYTLKIDASKALLSYLNRQLTPGQTRDFYIDTLVNNIYGETEDNATQRDRRRTIKKAIEELKTKKEYFFDFGMNEILKIKRAKNLILLD
jgi:hypothetical protein